MLTDTILKDAHTSNISNTVWTLWHAIHSELKCPAPEAPLALADNVDSAIAALFSISLPDDDNLPLKLEGKPVPPVAACCDNTALRADAVAVAAGILLNVAAILWDGISCCCV